MITCDRRICRIVWFICLVSLTTCVLVCIDFSGYIILTPESRIDGLRTFSQDGCIQVTWNKIKATNLSAIQINVLDDQGNTVISEQCNPNTTSFYFTKGEHGVPYLVEASLILQDKTETLAASSRSLFLRYGDLPALPFLNICTANNVQPTYQEVYPPTGCVGLGIDQNEYVDAEMKIIEEGMISYLDAVRIRIRGNTSATVDKKPYKLKLNTATDLLKEGEYPHTDWLLLPANNLNFIVGTETALLCGMEWQPRYRMVNVMLNGDYLGTYWLTESVSIGRSRCNIDESGYLIELDAYWWNSNGNYFKTNGQEWGAGYTFKYPDDEGLNEEKITAIRDYLNEMMYCLSENDPQYEDYIDIESWIGWLLTHDIIGSWDSAGTNLYYYKYNYDSNDPTATKLKMGPVWDFDSMYMQVEGWARVREFGSSCFPLLLKQSVFQKAYLDLWESISKTLSQSIEKKLVVWIEEKRADLEESMLLNSVRWKSGSRDLMEEVATVLEWFTSRVVWINEKLYE